MVAEECENKQFFTAFCTYKKVTKNVSLGYYDDVQVRARSVPGARVVIRIYGPAEPEPK